MYIPTSQLDSIQITSQFSFQTYKTVFRPPPHCFSLFKPAILEDNTQVEQFISFQFSYSVMSHSLQPHGLQHARPPCPLPTPGACSNSFPLSQWCHPTISSPVIPFSSCLHSFPTLGAFLMSQPLASSGQNTGVSPSSEYSGLISFRMDWLDLLAEMAIHGCHNLISILLYPIVWAS